MTDAGRSALFALLLAATLVLLGRAALRPPPLGPPAPAPRCPLPVEHAGDGVACLDEGTARTLGLHAGDRIAPDGSRSRMAPSRLELFEVPLDLNSAPLAELEALPGVGPGLAARIAAARPFSTVEALREVAGIGPRRWRVLRHRLVVTPAPAPD